MQIDQVNKKIKNMFFMDLTQASKNVARFMVRINLKAY